ncbi:MAG: ATP-grasp domain-containing protein [Verrucomicrobia bacterium]|jgi:D-aspartate ligase|nr:ATP-grasp domain-containing protein [Verrucomicrobiota bacterium]
MTDSPLHRFTDPPLHRSPDPPTHRPPASPKKHPPVLLLGADENESLPVLASLHRQGIPITAAAPRRISMGLFSRYPRHRLICPDPNEHPEAFVDWVEQTVRDGDYPVTMVCGETATWLLASALERLSPYTKIPIVDESHFFVCRDKSKTMQAAERLGIPIPKTYYPDDVGIEAVAQTIPAYPVVLKPCISNGARGISYPEDADDLKALYAKTKAEYKSCIVQEFVPHSGMQYKAEVVLDAEGKALVGGVYDKPRFYPPSGGSSTLNSTVDRPDILELATRFLQGIGWYGMGDCDFIMDPRDNTPKLMEVNPRFTRSIKILVEAGLDYPYILYCVAIGRSVEPQFNYRKGLYMRYFLSDCVWFLRSPDRFRARPSFFWFFGRNLRDEIFSWADPGPTLAYVVVFVSRLFNKKSRQSMLRAR